MSTFFPFSQLHPNAGTRLKAELSLFLILCSIPLLASGMQFYMIIMFLTLYLLMVCRVLELVILLQEKQRSILGPVCSQMPRDRMCFLGGSRMGAGFGADPPANTRTRAESSSGFLPLAPSHGESLGSRSSTAGSPSPCLTAALWLHRVSRSGGHLCCC